MKHPDFYQELLGALICLMFAGAWTGLACTGIIYRPH